MSFNPIQFYEFGKNRVKYNLMIGGVGYLITTPAILKNYFTFEIENIKAFKVDNNNVYAYINLTNYGAFIPYIDNVNITFFKETDGYLKSLATTMFQNCTQLSVKDIVVPGLTQLSSSCLRNVKRDGESIILPNITTTLSAPSLPIHQSQFKIILPNLQSVTLNMFNYMKDIHFVAHKLKTISSASNFNIANINTIIEVNEALIGTGKLDLVKTNGATVKFYDDYGNYVSTL